jgi:hypothetical protein
MAKIVELLPGTRNVREHKSSSACEVQTLTSSNGQQLIQFSTFGSENRATDGVSQTVQLDLEMAMKFRDALSDFISVNTP